MTRSNLTQPITATLLAAALTGCAASQPITMPIETVSLTQQPTQVALAATATTPSGSTDIESPSPPSHEAAPLMTLYRHGGLCVYGGCEWTFAIDEDGSAVIADGGSARIQTALSNRQIAELIALIEQTDFAAIKAVPFTDTCPTAYDGQESIYTFQTTRGEEVIASCQVVVDPALPLFRWIDELAASIQAG
jgi:hypothetical protein